MQWIQKINVLLIWVAKQRGITIEDAAKIDKQLERSGSNGGFNLGDAIHAISNGGKPVSVNIGAEVKKIVKKSTPKKKGK